MELAGTARGYERGDEGADRLDTVGEGAVRPSQGKTLAVMQVCGGSQSFNAVNQMRILGRWMRMFTIPNQSSVAKAWQEFDENGRMKPSSWYDRIVDVAEELFKITLLLRGQTSYLADRYSERKESSGTFVPRQSGKNITPSDRINTHHERFHKVSFCQAADNLTCVCRFSEDGRPD